MNLGGIPIGGSFPAGPVAARKRFRASRPARAAALLFLLGLLAPLPARAGFAALSGGTSSFPGAVEEGQAAVLPGDARVSERLFGLPGLSNVGRVAPGILRGAQPRPEGYETLRRMGVRTVVNLRSSHGEKKAVEAAGMRSVEVPMNSMKNVDPAAVRKVLAVLTDPASRPVFVHCALGKDRTGVVVAAYRMEIEGWSEAEAEAEMEAFGFHDIYFQIRKFVRRYPENRTKNGAGAGP